MLPDVLVQVDFLKGSLSRVLCKPRLKSQYFSLKLRVECMKQFISEWQNRNVELVSVLRKFTGGGRLSPNNFFSGPPSSMRIGMRRRRGEGLCRIKKARLPDGKI